MSYRGDAASIDIIYHRLDQLEFWTANHDRNIQQFYWAINRKLSESEVRFQQLSEIASDSAIFARVSELESHVQHLSMIHKTAQRLDSVIH